MKFYGGLASAGSSFFVSNCNYSSNLEKICNFVNKVLDINIKSLGINNGDIFWIEEDKINEILESLGKEPIDWQIPNI